MKTPVLTALVLSLCSYMAGQTNVAATCPTCANSSPPNWYWTNPAIASSGQLFNSPSLNLEGSFYNGTSKTDYWSIQNVLSGTVTTSPISTLTFLHSGSSGTAVLQAPGFLAQGSGGGGFGFSAGSAPNLNNYTSTIVEFAPTSVTTYGLARSGTGATGMPQWVSNGGSPQTLTETIIDNSCGILDNALCTSLLDSLGNPGFLSVNTGPTVTVSAGSPNPNLVYFVGGIYQVVNSNLTPTTNLNKGATGSAAINFIYILQDTSNPNPVVGDIGITTIAPVYQYEPAPTCPSGATSSNLGFWFDLSVNKMKSCSGGAYATNPAIFLGAIAIDSSGNSQGIAHEPFRLNPYRRYELFGNGSVAATNIIASGNTLTDGWQQYSDLCVTGSSSVLSHDQIATSAPNANGLYISSQNPVLIVNGGKISSVGAGLAGAAGTTVNGTPGTTGGIGGAGGGGGGAHTTHVGGSGGNRLPAAFLSPNTGGGGGGAAGSAGSPGQSPTNLGPLQFDSILLAGAGGGSGGGDGTNNAGAGGTGGGVIAIRAPSLIIGSTSSIASDGSPGGSVSTGTAGGGGGGEEAPYWSIRLFARRTV